MAKHKITFKDLLYIQLAWYKQIHPAWFIIKIITGYLMVAGSMHMCTTYIIEDIYNCMVPDHDMDGNLVRWTLQYYLPDSSQ